MVTYTISNIPCNLFVLIWHLPFNLHYRLNGLQIRTITASTSLFTLLFTSIISPSNTYSIAIGNTTIFVDMYHNALQCKELFDYDANMKTHMIDDRSQSRKSHICRCRDECKKILRYGHLRTHLLIYIEEKHHPCRQREVSCREAESLNKHILNHSGENPHSCTECKRAF